MIVYKITNLINGKVYVGLTTTSLKQRWNSHVYSAFYAKNKCTAIAAAIQKYGKENFKIEEIDRANSKQELSKKEVFWIEQLKSRENGYNIRSGGEVGYINSPETNAKNREKHLGKRLSEESKKKISDALKGKANPFYGKKHSNEAKVKMAVKKTGTIHSLELRQKRSELNRQKFLNGELNSKLKAMRDGWNKVYCNAYSFLNPDGKVVEGKNLRQLCKHNNLCQGHMWSVLNGKRKSHKGWTKNPNLNIVKEISEE